MSSVCKKYKHCGRKKNSGGINKKNTVVNLESEIKKLAVHLPRKGDNIKLPVLKSKLNIEEVRKNIKSKNDILKENLEKLKLIKEACTIQLDKTLQRQIIQRGVTKRPVTSNQKVKKAQKTAFTEEDFRKFEEEFMNE